MSYYFCYKIHKYEHLNSLLIVLYYITTSVCFFNKAGSTNCQNSPQTEKSDSRKDLQLQTARSHLDSSGRNTRSTALKLRRSVLEHSPLPVTSKQPDINASNDESTASAGMFLSGEWVRPRSYICGACSQTFTDLYEIEEHKVTIMLKSKVFQCVIDNSL